MDARSEAGPSGLSLAGLSEAFRDGSLRPVALTEALLDRIERLNGQLLAFTRVTRERALGEARTAEAALRLGDPRPLLGIPYAVKEHFDVAGVATMVGTPLLADNIAEADSAAVERLAAAGMVLLGKTHTVQLGGGITGVNQQLGTPWNPWRREHHVPGGSSSGSAVAVAAGLVPVALGAEAGGSVRLPAALCGRVGFKPTVGRISRAGVHPTSHTLDCVGIMARHAADVAPVYRALRGTDPRDAATLRAPPLSEAVALQDGVAGLRLALPRNLLFDGAEPEVEAAVRAAITVLESRGAELVELEIPELDEVQALEHRFAITAVETYAANIALWQRHAGELDPLLDWLADAARIPDAVYQGMLRQQRDIARRVAARLAGVDALLAPTSLVPAPVLRELLPAGGPYRERYDDGGVAERLTRNAAMANFLGLCGVTVPCGFTTTGLPIGLHIYGKAWQEDLALRIAAAYQRASDWHGRDPDLSWIES